ncbi:MAG: hypothetical protein Q9161_006088 [Pseudevernia consocians]
MPEADTMEGPETTSQRGESTEVTQKSHTTSKTNRTFLTIFPQEVRDMIYELVLGDHTIHIKSDIIPEKPDSKDDMYDDKNDEDSDDKDDEDSDDDYENSEDDDDGPDDEERRKWPAELLELTNDDRGPLYHSTCNKELQQPKDALLYRIRSIEANGSRDSRVQSNIVVKDFKHVKCPRLPDSHSHLECETIGSLEEDDKPTVQVKLAFLRVNKQVYEEASTILYSTRTFGFDDPATFAQFFSISYNPLSKPTSTVGTSLLATKRNTIRSIHFRAKTALFFGQKFRWMYALDSATFVLLRLEKIRVLFDLCHEGKESWMDRTLWQSCRHRNGFPLLKTAEVRVASHLYSCAWRDPTKGEDIYAHLDATWRVELLEAIVGYHMDVFFGASLLDSASVAKRDANFLRE